MHVAFVCHIYEASDSPGELLDKHFSTVNWAEALAEKGLKVSVLYRFSTEGQIERGGVSYRFFSDEHAGSLRNWKRASTFYSKVKSYVENEDVDLIHAHDLFAFGPHYSLSSALRSTPILVQDHSGLSPVKYPWLYRLTLRHVKAFMFSAKGMEANWTKKKIIEKSKCFFVMENTSSFELAKRSEARTQSGLWGEPLVLSVGNLNKNKDPFTLLSAFERLLKVRPKARLYLIYRQADLESQIRDKILPRPELSESVQLLGEKERKDLPVFYNSADLFVLGSHREIWSYSAIEALSCGAMPVLSDIPSSRALLREGQIGSLHKPGNADSLFDALMIQIENLDVETPIKVRSFFDKYWSFDQLAGQSIQVYESVLKAND